MLRHHAGFRFRNFMPDSPASQPYAVATELGSAFGARKQASGTMSTTRPADLRMRGHRHAVGRRWSWPELRLELARITLAVGAGRNYVGRRSWHHFGRRSWLASRWPSKLAGITLAVEAGRNNTVGSRAVVAVVNKPKLSHAALRRFMPHAVAEEWQRRRRGITAPSPRNDSAVMPRNESVR